MDETQFDLQTTNVLGSVHKKMKLSKPRNKHLFDNVYSVLLHLLHVLYLFALKPKIVIFILCIQSSQRNCMYILCKLNGKRITSKELFLSN